MIGPHNGRELELMLSGEKKFARFTLELDSPHEVGDEEFAPHVESGRIRKHVVLSETGPRCERRYYYLDGEEWRVKLDLLITRCLHTAMVPDFGPEDLHRMDGWLLGYAAEDIEDFVRARRRDTHCASAARQIS